MSEPKGIVDNFECFLIDLDGVIWRGNRVLKEAVESVNKLIKRGKKVVFLSNNATKSRREFEGKLNLAGVMISNENAMVVSSAYATAIFIREELGTGSAYVVGEEGLMEELKLAGIRVVNDRFTWNMPVDYVVVGLDRTFTYEKLACAVNAIY
ncbi:MAG: HAD family hydrolase, partial [Thermoprotei archaeon]